MCSLHLTCYVWGGWPAWHNINGLPCLLASEWFELTERWKGNDSGLFIFLAVSLLLLKAGCTCLLLKLSLNSYSSVWIPVTVSSPSSLEPGDKRIPVVTSPRVLWYFLLAFLSIVGIFVKSPFIKLFNYPDWMHYLFPDMLYPLKICGSHNSDFMGEH